MRSQPFKITLLFVFSMLLLPLALSATESPIAGKQGSRPGDQEDDQKYTGLWVGTYTGVNGDSGDVSFTLSKDDKGQWRGTVKYSNENGEQKADLLSLQITDGKMKTKIETSDGKAEATIEGQFQGDKLEGSYTISPKDTGEIGDRGTWKTTKSTAVKPAK